MIKTMLLRVPPRMAPSLESCPLWTENNSSQMLKSPSCKDRTILSIFCHQISNQACKWWKWQRSQMWPMQMSEVSTCRSKRWEKRLSCLCNTRNCIRRLVLIHRKVCCSGDHQAQVKLCLLKLWPQNQMQTLSEWLVLNSFKSILVRVHAWFVMCSDKLERTSLLLSLLMR